MAVPFYRAIARLDAAMLMDLKRRIVERLQFLQQQKTAAALQDIKIGSGVSELWCSDRVLCPNYS